MQLVWTAWQYAVQETLGFAGTSGGGSTTSTGGGLPDGVYDPHADRRHNTIATTTVLAEETGFADDITLMS